MQDQNSPSIDLEEAGRALASVSRRIALLHLAYARAIMNELGQERGTRLISEAIKDYALKIGEKTKAEVEDQGYEAIPENFEKGLSYALPKIPGMHSGWEVIHEPDGRKKLRANGCILGKVWKEYGQEKLGRLYCYMDTAKYMGYNPLYKLVHHQALPDGDECCEFEVQETTPEERDDFATPGRDWFYMDG
ncbi:MAG: L-2-amino-thiazoline-4-carboxylic acid hydrolase [Desulfovermiculus sp.]|nr:L-2-amino-thiazoline-4-carboxylic acid hydrolase [Desulfovermiculus sp.]